MKKYLFLFITIGTIVMSSFTIADAQKSGQRPQEASCCQTVQEQTKAIKELQAVISSQRKEIESLKKQLEVCNKGAH